MVISRALSLPLCAGALCAALLLSACGRHGIVPTPQEQNQIQSMSVAPAANEPFAVTMRMHGFGHFLEGMNLSQTQQTQLRALVTQFKQSHAPGSAFDPQGLRALHEQMFALLTPDQQTQFMRNMVDWHVMRHAGLLGVDLTDRQRAQIHQLIAQFRQAHPPGSAVDPQAKATLHQQILNLLTPQQRAQLEQLRGRWTDQPPTFSSQ